MKCLLLVLPTLFVMLSSCSSIEDNSPALQGLKDTELFRATTTTAIMNEDGSLRLFGENSSGESVNFLINSGGPQVTLGGSEMNEDVLIYTDQIGRQFSTSFDDASGVLNYTINGLESISGDFRFTAFTPAQLDTVVFSRGIIFKVPFITQMEPIEVPDAEVSDQFIARVNSLGFFPTIITKELESGVLTISGVRSNSRIDVVLPASTVPGTYNLVGGTSIFAIYSDNVSEYASVSGQLEIVSNDTTNNILVGTFSFETEGFFTITEGSFTINY